MVARGRLGEFADVPRGGEVLGFRHGTRVEHGCGRKQRDGDTTMNANSKPLIEAPASVPGGASYQTLGYIDAYDAILNADYAFVAYKETDSGGDWRVRIRSSQTAGGVFEPSLIQSQARAATAQGKPWFPWGYSLDPSAGDPRQVQFRVHVRNGQPTTIEIYLQMRNADGSAAAPKTLTFAWPS